MTVDDFMTFIMLYISFPIALIVFIIGIFICFLQRYYKPLDNFLKDKLKDKLEVFYGAEFLIVVLATALIIVLIPLLIILIPILIPFGLLMLLLQFAAKSVSTVLNKYEISKRDN